jgi:glucan 1,3-beta-glucosidase
MFCGTETLQIGYYHLVGVYPEMIKGTDFAGLGSVFEGAWTRIVGAISTAERYGIGVLIGTLLPLLPLPPPIS